MSEIDFTLYFEVIEADKKAEKLIRLWKRSQQTS